MKIWFAGVIGPRREKMLIALGSRKRLLSYFEIVDPNSGFSAEGDFKLLVSTIKKRVKKK